MPTAAPRDAVAGVVRETRVCDGDSGAGSVGGGRQCGVLVLAHGSCARRTRAGYRQARVAGGICRHKRLQQARRRQRRTGLGLDTRLVQLISANGARICGVRESRGASTRGVPGAQRRCRWARDHSWQQAGGLAGWRAGGRAGAPVQMSQDQNVTAFLSRRATPAQTPSLRPGCCRHKEPTRQGRAGAPHHFFTTKRGPSLLSFSTSISSSSAIPPRWKLPRCETSASGALRAGSGLSAPARALEWCVRHGTQPRLASLAVHAPSKPDGTHSIYTSAMCASGVTTTHTVHLPPRAATPWCCPDPPPWGTAERGRTAMGTAQIEVCGAGVRATGLQAPLTLPLSARARLARNRPRQLSAFLLLEGNLSPPLAKILEQFRGWHPPAGPPNPKPRRRRRRTQAQTARSHGSRAAFGNDWAAQGSCARRWPPATHAARQHGPAAEQVHHACGQPGPGELERLGHGDAARQQRDRHRGAARTAA